MVPIKTAEINRSNYGGRRTVQPQWIVMHYTANDGDSDESNVRYFQDNIVKASAHYFVDDDSITRTVPDDYVAVRLGAHVKPRFTRQEHITRQHRRVFGDSWQAQQ